MSDCYIVETNSFDMQFCDLHFFPTVYCFFTDTLSEQFTVHLLTSHAHVCTAAAW